jgi:uncharacterized C2H2 Zn-finger protein
MASARRKSASANSSTSANGSGELTCSECGKTFTRAASLGAHRNRAHGVAGATNSARRRRTAANRSRGRANVSGRVDRDALLRALFPDGVPPREDVIRSANAWLDEAERLARAT